jgi:hypothetical protein
MPVDTLDLPPFQGIDFEIDFYHLRAPGRARLAHYLLSL